VKSRGFLPALPALILLFVFFLFPVVRMLGFSLESGTLDWYAKALGEQLYLRVFWNTFEIALLVTFFCLLLGYPLGFLMATTTPFWATVGFIFVLLPLWTSVLVRTYAWIVVLGNNGMVNRLLMWTGLTDSPVSFLYNELGVMIGMANVLLPFLVLPLFAAMLRIDDRLMQAAASMGAPARTIFLKVFLPLTLPALAAGALLVFILCLGFYVTPAILGGGKVPMISNLLDFLINQIPRWEQASAMSTILLVVTLAIFAAYRALDRKVGA